MYIVRGTNELGFVDKAANGNCGINGLRLGPNACGYSREEKGKASPETDYVSGDVFKFSVARVPKIVHTIREQYFGSVPGAPGQF